MYSSDIKQILFSFFGTKTNTNVVQLQPTNHTCNTKNIISISKMSSWQLSMLPRPHITAPKSNSRPKFGKNGVLIIVWVQLGTKTISYTYTFRPIENTELAYSSTHSFPFIDANRVFGSLYIYISSFIIYMITSIDKQYLVHCLWSLHSEFRAFYIHVWLQTSN